MLQHAACPPLSALPGLERSACLPNSRQEPPGPARCSHARNIHALGACARTSRRSMVCTWAQTRSAAAADANVTKPNLRPAAQATRWWCTRHSCTLRLDNNAKDCVAGATARRCTAYTSNPCSTCVRQRHVREPGRALHSPPRPVCLPVVADKRLRHNPKVLKIRAQLVFIRLPAQPANEHLASAVGADPIHYICACTSRALPGAGLRELPQASGRLSK